jgi:hypothetical protein
MRNSVERSTYVSYPASKTITRIRNKVKKNIEKKLRNEEADDAEEQEEVPRSKTAGKKRSVRREKLEEEALKTASFPTGEDKNRKRSKYQRQLKDTRLHHGLPS